MLHYDYYERHFKIRKIIQPSHNCPYSNNSEYSFYSAFTPTLENDF